MSKLTMVHYDDDLVAWNGDDDLHLVAQMKPNGEWYVSVLHGGDALICDGYHDGDQLAEYAEALHAEALEFLAECGNSEEE